MLRKHGFFIGIRIQNPQNALAQLGGGFQRLHQTGADVPAQNQTVHHDLNIVF